MTRSQRDQAIQHALDKMNHAIAKDRPYHAADWARLIAHIKSSFPTSVCAPEARRP